MQLPLSNYNTFLPTVTQVTTVCDLPIHFYFLVDFYFINVFSNQFFSPHQGSQRFFSSPFSLFLFTGIDFYAKPKTMGKKKHHKPPKLHTFFFIISLQGKQQFILAFPFIYSSAHLFSVSQSCWLIFFLCLSSLFISKLAGGYGCAYSWGLFCCLFLSPHIFLAMSKDYLLSIFSESSFRRMWKDALLSFSKIFLQEAAFQPLES